MLGCLLLAPASHADTLSGQVISVPDANRILLQTDDGRRLPVALLGIAPPTAKDRDWREIAQHQLHRMLAGRIVTVEFTTRDERGVILGEVRHGGADLGLRLLRSGLAVTNPADPMPPGLKMEYQEAEELARRHRMGCWQSDRNLAPTRLQGESSHEQKIQEKVR